MRQTGNLQRISVFRFLGPPAPILGPPAPKSGPPAPAHQVLDFVPEHGLWQLLGETIMLQDVSGDTTKSSR